MNLTFLERKEQRDFQSFSRKMENALHFFFQYLFSVSFFIISKSI